MAAIGDLLRPRGWCAWLVLMSSASTPTVTLLSVTAAAQTASSQAPASQVAADQSATATAAPLTLTLQEAIERAHKNSPEYRAALTEFGLAKEDRVQSRAALLPNANYNAAFLYNEGNGSATGKFIGYNGVHEYLSQGNVHQVVSLENIADYRRSTAAAA